MTDDGEVKQIEQVTDGINGCSGWSETKPSYLLLTGLGGCAGRCALDSKRFSACEAAWSGRIGFRFWAGHYADAIRIYGWQRVEG